MVKERVSEFMRTGRVRPQQSRKHSTSPKTSLAMLPGQSSKSVARRERRRPRLQFLHASSQVSWGIAGCGVGPAASRGAAFRCRRSVSDWPRSSKRRFPPPSSRVRGSGLSAFRSTRSLAEGASYPAADAGLEEGVLAEAAKPSGLAMNAGPIHGLVAEMGPVSAMSLSTGKCCSILGVCPIFNDGTSYRREWLSQQRYWFMCRSI